MGGFIGEAAVSSRLSKLNPDNYKGWILGNEHDDYWRQQIYKRKEKLYNPIKQNYGHVMTYALDVVEA
jgi:hypothetical protein